MFVFHRRGPQQQRDIPCCHDRVHFGNRYGCLGRGRLQLPDGCGSQRRRFRSQRPVHRESEQHRPDRGGHQSQLRPIRDSAHGLGADQGVITFGNFSLSQGGDADWTALEGTGYDAGGTTPWYLKLTVTVESGSSWRTGILAGRGASSVVAAGSPRAGPVQYRCGAHLQRAKDTPGPLGREFVDGQCGTPTPASTRGSSGLRVRSHANGTRGDRLILRWHSTTVLAQNRPNSPSVQPAWSARRWLLCSVGPMARRHPCTDFRIPAALRSIVHRTLRTPGPGSDGRRHDSRTAPAQRRSH